MDPVHRAPKDSRGLYGRFNRLFRAALRWLFGRIHFPEPASNILAELNKTHTVVVVTRGHSSWLALAFCHILARSPLPGLGYVGGVNFFWHRPWRRLWLLVSRLLGDSTAPFPLDVPELAPDARSQRLARAILNDRPALIMLPVSQSHADFWVDWTDYLQAIVATARHSQKPIALVPQILVAREQSGRGERGVVDWIFGGSRKPGLMRSWAMLWMLRHGVIRQGDSVKLDDHLAEKSAPARSVARELRELLHARMDEEERVVAGPKLTGFEQMARQVLSNPEVRQTIAEEGARHGRSEPQLEVHAEALLRQIAANYDVRIIKAMEHVLFWLFHRIYDGMAVDEDGLGRVIAASRRGPVIFCPSHKSHVDYLVLSYVLWTHGVAPPHVAAGANLGFFPLGTLFRRCGAFFIRRSFRGAPIYAALMRAYLAHLVKQGTSVEFFLEGTRSRTGKLLPPKFGLLGMLVRAWRKGAREDLVFVPVSIDYERIIEAKAYSRELGGANKKAEDFGGLLRSTKVLRSRYGRVQVQFGEPLSLADWWRHNASESSDEEEVRLAIERLGYRVLHDVSRVCTVTPVGIVATVLLSHPSRGIAQSTLIERSAMVVNFLAALAARLSEPVAREETRVSAILEATFKLVDEHVLTLERAGAADREPIFRVRDEGRVTLDYHKNAIINYFAALALVSRALIRHPKVELGVRLDALKKSTLFLAQVFRHEFVYPQETSTSDAFEETVGVLSVLEVLEVDDSGLVRAQRVEMVALLARLLDSFVEGYSVVAQAALELRDETLPEREFVTRALERTRRAYLEGDITRPEAASRTLTETALNWLVDNKFLEASEGRRRIISLPQDLQRQAELEQLITDLGAYAAQNKGFSPAA